MGSSSSSSVRPCQIKTLKTISQGENSAKVESQSNFTLDKIENLYQKFPINTIQIAERPVQSTLIQIAKALATNNLNHWQLIAKFNETNYWLICFSEQGLTNLVGMDKQKILNWNGRFRNNQITRQIPFKSGTKVADIIAAIKEVISQKYDAAAWNCQCFTHHIINKIG